VLESFLRTVREAKAKLGLGWKTNGIRGLRNLGQIARIPFFLVRKVSGAGREGAFLFEVREVASPWLQSRSPSRQSVRDLQEQPAFQGSSAL